MDRLGVELDAIRQDVLDSRGERDAAYIRRLVRVQRVTRARQPPGADAEPQQGRLAWRVRRGLTLAKVLDNMEIGHNVLHGQWDWMRDPKIHSSTWEWDHVSPAAQWKRAHNETHHTYTNIIGQDNDLGYGIMRVDEEQEWTALATSRSRPWNFVTACIFEYGIAMFDLDLGDHLARQARHVAGEEGGGQGRRWPRHAASWARTS